jgi:hypothetical protein
VHSFRFRVLYADSLTDTVDGKVEVHHWDEDNDDVDLNDGELFWRQSYDMSKKPPVYSVRCCAQSLFNIYIN